MKRNEFLRYIRFQGRELIREGGRHSWCHNPLLHKRSAIPRHNKIIDNLARKICKDLGIPSVK